MNEFRLLIVEDDQRELNICRDTVDRYKHQKGREVELVECKNVKEASSKLDNSIDGAIIDLNLNPGNQEYEGNDVIQEIEKSHFRIPVIILTGTPDAADKDFANIGILKKGDPGTGYADLLDDFWDIHNTGLTRIMGGRGIIEENLNKVFRNNLLKQVETWIEYGKNNSLKTEKALLRYTLNHLLQLLDDDEDRCYPEEVYLAPPLTEKIRTGSLVKKKNGGGWFAVMTPACDLVKRENNKRNTDRILIIEVEPTDTLFPWFQAPNLSNNKKGELEKAFKNNKSDYYHWLPKTDSFEGGFLNFRKLVALESDEFDGKFKTPPKVQISPSFVKDIVARFSSYYARQGQPEIDFDGFINT